MSPCRLAQSVCPRHFPFDLLHPPYRRLCHTFFNSLPASPPSHQITERGRLLQRNAISSANVATALSLSFSHHFTHKCFSSFYPFLSSPGRTTRGGDQTGTQWVEKLGHALLCSALFHPHVLGCLTWQPPCHVLYSPLPFPSFFLPSPSISISICCLLRRGNNERDQQAGFATGGLCARRGSFILSFTWTVNGL